MTSVPRLSNVEELRQAALLATVYVRIEAARQYGFIEGGPTINVDRCEDVIAQAREHDITFTEEEIGEAARYVFAWSAMSAQDREDAIAIVRGQQ